MTIMNATLLIVVLDLHNQSAGGDPIARFATRAARCR